MTADLTRQPESRTVPGIVITRSEAMSQLDPLVQLLSRRPKRLALLEQIAEQGSITRAAKAAGLSYKAAWDAIDELNNLAERPLVSRSVGGKGGGVRSLQRRANACCRCIDACRRYRHNCCKPSMTMTTCNCSAA